MNLTLFVLAFAIYSLVISIPVEHDSLLFFSEQKCGKSTVTYAIISSSNGHVFHYEPNDMEEIEKCTTPCLCSGVHYRYSLTYTHLMHAQRKRNYDIRQCDHFVNVEEFIVQAHSAGYNIVLVNEPQNLLLKLISSLESIGGAHNYAFILKKLKSKQMKLLQAFQTQSLALIVARLKALSLGMRIVNFNFIFDGARPHCAIVKSTKATLGNLNLISSSAYHNLCGDSLNASTDYSPFFSVSSETLLERVGPDAMTLLTRILQNTSYEWMLDLNAHTWPNPMLADPYYDINPYYHIGPLATLKPAGPKNNALHTLLSQYRSVRCLCPECVTKAPTAIPSPYLTITPSVRPSYKTTAPPSLDTQCCCSNDQSDCQTLVETSCELQCANIACKQASQNWNCNCIHDCSGDSCSARNSNNPCGSFGTCCCGYSQMNFLVYGNACTSCGTVCAQQRCSTRHCDDLLLE